MELLTFDYWKCESGWYLLPTISISKGIYYSWKLGQEWETLRLHIMFLRFRVKWVWLTRRVHNGQS